MDPAPFPAAPQAPAEPAAARDASGTAGAAQELLRAGLRRLFGDLEEAALAPLQSRARLRRLGRGEVLYQQGEAGHALHLLLTGRLEVRVRGADAQERVIARPLPGQSVGEVALFTGAPRAATIVALRDCMLAEVERADYEALVALHPPVLTHLARSLVQRFSAGQAQASSAAQTRCVAVQALHPSVRLGAVCHTLQAALQGLTRATRVDEAMGKAHLGCDFDEVALGRWIDELEAMHGFVLLQVEGSHSWVQRCLGLADRVLRVADARCEPAHAESAPSAPPPVSSTGGVRVDLVLLHPPSARPSRTSAWMQPGLSSVHHLQSDDAAGFNRLARFLSDRSMGLVLAGGGARGFAHIGVLRALAELGVPVDSVGGTSFGALAATGPARGLSAQDMLEELSEAFARRSPLSDYTLPLVSLVRGGTLDRLLQQRLPQCIEDLWLPYFAVSSNLSRNRVQVHDRGLLWRAVRASVSLPAVLPPVISDGDMLVDGGVLNNLPVDVMRERTRGTVMAVDLNVEQEYQLGASAPPSALEVLKSWIRPGTEARRAPTLARIIMKTSTLASHREAQAARAAAHLYLNIALQGIDMLDWQRFREIVRMGYEQALPQLQRWCDSHPEQVHRDSALPMHDPLLQ